MFNLNDIMQAAQGGQGITNLAQQFGLSPEQAQAAVKSLIPAFSQGLQNKAGDPNGLGSIISAITQGGNQQSFNDPNATQAAAGAGSEILGSLFGGSHITQQVAQQAAAQAGVRPDILMQMMPVVASMVMGGMFKSMQNQGMGGLLGQLTSAASGAGGLGAVLGQVMNAQPGAAGAPAGANPAAGGLMGMLSSLLGGLLGGAGAQPAGGASALPGGLNPALVQEGMAALQKMMQPGMQVAADHQANLQSVLGTIFKPTT